MTPTTLAAPVVASHLKPSSQFRSEAIKSILAIVAFIVVYILLFILALGLVALCVSGGVLLIANFPRLLTLIIGLGLIGVGAMVLFFLVKFLFDSNKTDTSAMLRVTAADQPQLVAFIEEIAREAGAARPGKIFLAQDVNACVFYNSSFWSMFLPVRKNLMIGLGLVNTLNKSELKAVIAHEFGHFSQRSMKLGSFVYNVNHIIFNMLYRNTGFSKGLSSFASVHAVFYVCAHITAGIVQGIQQVLKQMYKLVNLSYLGLSRQMEFHADLVAATISGSNNIIASLQTLELAEQSYQATLGAYNKLLEDNKRATNLYQDHGTVFHQFIQANAAAAEGGLPAPAHKSALALAPRVNVSNQWASHPTTEERKAYLEPFNLSGMVDETPAWSLFANAADLQQELTSRLYSHIPDLNSKAAIDAGAFASFYQQQLQVASLPKVFGSYYDDRDIAPFDTNEQKQQETGAGFHQFFTSELAGIPRQLAALQQDIALLTAVKNKEIDTRSFDFDGVKYNRNDADLVIQQLASEATEAKQRLQKTDQQLFCFFYRLFQSRGAAAAAAYEAAMQAHFDRQQKAEQHLELLNGVVEELGPILAGQTINIDVIHRMIHTFKNGNEPLLKTSLSSYLQAGAFNHDPGLKTTVAGFIQKEYAYFNGEAFFDNEIAELHSMIQEAWSAILHFNFEHYKTLLTLQADALRDIGE